MKLLTVSTSTIHGQPWLAYLQPEIIEFFKGVSKVLFIPFARPSGITYEDYTAKAQAFFLPLGIQIKGAHSFSSALDAANWAEGFFTGGGNTFLLLKTMHETGLFEAIDARVRAGVPYMGTSAGCNLCGPTIGTTNDMPVVHPPSLKAFGWLPFNLNPHYLDPPAGSTHMGETRETRIGEFHHFNPQPVLGLREGSWLRKENGRIELKGPHTARWFEKDKQPVELQPGLIEA